MKWLCALLFVGCAGTVPAPSLYASHQDEVTYGSSIRLLVACGGARAGGTGVAVGPFRVLTAQHVVDECTGAASETITGTLLDGSEIQLRFTRLASGDGVDAALLSVVGKPLHVWALVSPRQVYTGEYVCSIGGAAMWTKGMKKCGYVGYSRDGWLFVSLQAIPGNSGSPVYDASGYVVGLLVRGTWEGEPVMIAQLATTFRDLL